MVFDAFSAMSDVCAGVAEEWSFDASHAREISGSRKELNVEIKV